MNILFSRDFSRTLLLGGILTLISGCGWYTDDSVDLIDNDIVTPLPDDDGIDDGDPDGPQLPQDPRQISLSVEATTGMQEASVSQRLWQWLTPAGAYATDVGDPISGARIFVSQIDYEGRTRTGVVSPGDYSLVQNNDTTYTITFNGDIPDRLDLVVVAELSNGVQLRHLLPPEKRAIRVNAASEYAIRELFSRFESPADLEQLASCSSGDFECVSRLSQRLILAQAMTVGLQDFEISVSDRDTLDEVLEDLDSRFNIRDFAEKSADSVVNQQLLAVSGNTVSTVMDNRSGKYNSVYYALGVNELSQDQGGGIVFSHRFSQTLERLSGDVVLYEYPSLIFTPTILGLFNNLIYEDLPFGRQTLTRTADGSYIQGVLPNNDDIVEFAGSTVSFLSEQGLFDLARAQIQDVVVPFTGSNPQGWLFNPHYTQLYTARNPDSGENSDSLVTAFWNDGQRLELRQTGTNRYERVGVVEEQNTLGWIFHSLQTDDVSGLTAVEGNDYVVVSFENVFGNEPVQSYVGDIQFWQVNGTDVTRSYPASAEGAFGRLVINRNSDESIGRTEVQESLDSLTLEADPEQQYDNRSGTYESVNKGRLLAGTWSGFTDPEGNVMTFLTDNGQGIAHAVQVTDAALPPNLSNASYVLFGNAVTLDGNRSHYRNYNGSRLEWVDNQPVLRLRETTNTANHTSLQVEAATDTSARLQPAVAGSQSTFGTGILNSVVFEFADPEGGSTPLRLEGMSASDGNLLILRLDYGNSTGLLYAFRELSLSADSE